MTLEEAIIHAEAVADRCAVTDGNIKCEIEHRQLAAWLKELKKRREKDVPDTNVGDTISRQAAIDVVRKCRVIEVTPAYILIDKGEAVSELAMLPSAQSKTVCVAKVTLSDEQIQEAVEKVKNEVVQVLPFAQPEWNNHTVACLLAELFDDTCACNYNGIDEWLPEKCEVIDSCPNPVGVACWEQYLKHRAERRTDE